MILLFLLAAFFGRAPRGARGLKCWLNGYSRNGVEVVPLAGHVD